MVAASTGSEASPPGYAIRQERSGRSAIAACNSLTAASAGQTAVTSSAKGSVSNGIVSAKGSNDSYAA